MHVDGFRFDLATILGARAARLRRGRRLPRRLPAGPGAVNQVKLIAEPWDCGPGGYQVGGFPPGWAEWNDRFRDTVRAFWKGDEGKLPDLAARLTGSADLFNKRGRKPWASVNFITAHDGFTLHDLVSYNDKHNEANGEDNRDGHSQQPLVELRRRRPDRRPGDHGAARAPDAQHAGDAAAVAGHADAAGRRRVRPHARAATTTPTARTTRSPGSTGRHRRRRRGDLREFTAALIAHPRSA